MVLGVRLPHLILEALYGSVTDRGRGPCGLDLGAAHLYFASQPVAASFAYQWVKVAAEGCSLTDLLNH